MRLEVFEETQPDAVVRLKLKKDEDGDDSSVYVVAVDGNGSELVDGYLLSFDADGTISLFVGVNDALGFQLDREGRIRLTED